MSRGGATAELEALAREEPEAVRRFAEKRDDAIRERLLSLLENVEDGGEG